MGKYAKYKKKAKSSKNNVTIMVIAIVVGILALLMVMLVVLSRSGALDRDYEPSTTGQTGGDSSGQNAQNPTPGIVQNPTQPSDAPPPVGLNFNFANGEVLPIDQGIVVTNIASYTGLYMEDGKNDVVSDMMMVTVKNTTEQDLQLATFTLEYMEFSAQFKISNLPAGATVIALEQNRHPYVNEGLRTVKTERIVFFDEPMSRMEDTFEIVGAPNTINIKNISGQDITGRIHIYYKNYAGNNYYGGITFKNVAEGGLKAGEIKQLMGEMYDPRSCQIVDIKVESP